MRLDSMTEDQRDKWNKLLIKRGVRPPTPAATVEPVEQTRQANSHMNISGKISYRKCYGGMQQSIGDVTEFHIREKKDVKKLQQLWRDSDMNKRLLLYEPEYKYPTGNMSGCHLLIVMFAYPWSISWLLGYDRFAIESVRKNYIKKHPLIYKKASELANGRIPRTDCCCIKGDSYKIYRRYRNCTFERYNDILAFIKSDKW